MRFVDALIGFCCGIYFENLFVALLVCTLIIVILHMLTVPKEEKKD